MTDGGPPPGPAARGGALGLRPPLAFISVALAAVALLAELTGLAVARRIIPPGRISFPHALAAAHTGQPRGQGPATLPPDPESPDEAPADLANQIGTQLQQLKWFCWHGNVFRALQTVDDLIFDLDTAEPAVIEQARLLKAVREFDAYLRANAGRIPNYGERHRAGEAISTAFTESAVNQVISKRMVKKQQMPWTPRGPHLLLQVRTRVLNDQLAGDFRRWYPGFNQAPDPAALAA